MLFRSGIFLTGAGLGWRLAEDGVEFRGKTTIDDLKAAPRFGEDIKVNHEKIREDAHHITDHLREEGGMTLPRLMGGKTGDQVLHDSILIGYMAKKKMVEFTRLEGQVRLNARA